MVICQNFWGVKIVALSLYKKTTNLNKNEATIINFLYSYVEFKGLEKHNIRWFDLQRGDIHLNARFKLFNWFLEDSVDDRALEIKLFQSFAEFFNAKTLVGPASNVQSTSMKIQRRVQ